MKHIVVALSLFCFANATHASLRDRLSGFSAGAHRGGVQNFASNTLRQFKQAVKENVDVIEMDLRVSQDGVVVIMHDEDLKPKTSCKGKVQETPWSKIKKCRVIGAGSQTVPSFEDVLIAINGDAVINAEFKDLESIAPALALIEKYDATDWVFFQTQAKRAKYYEARTFSRSVNLLYKVENQEELDWALGLNDENLAVIELPMNFNSLDVIAQIHQANKLALENTWRYVWHDEYLGPACDKVFKKGVDIAISNTTKGCVNQAKKFNEQSALTTATAAL
jgi:glycerophosphoryl diester phosphodiesterase